MVLVMVGAAVVCNQHLFEKAPAMALDTVRNDQTARIIVRRVPPRARLSGMSINVGRGVLNKIGGVDVGVVVAMAVVGVGVGETIF